MKIGFVVTAHYSDEYRPGGGEYIRKFCESVNLHCKYDFNLYVIDNASQYTLDIPDNAIYVYIENQTKEGITGAWNLGINKAYVDNCDIIINCSDDQYFNDTINVLIDYIITHPNVNALYSGLTNGVLAGSQLSNKPHAGIQVKTGHDILNGFCFAMLRSHYEKFRFENDKYFNINNKYNGGDGKWGGQEGQFMENSERGLFSIIVNECFIPHIKVRGWTKLKGK